MRGLELGFGQKPSVGSISGSIQELDRSVDRSRPLLSEQRASGSIRGSIQMFQSISGLIGTRLLRAISAGSIQAFFPEHRGALDRSVDRSKASPIDWEHSNRSGSDRCVGFKAAGERGLRHLFTSSSQIHSSSSTALYKHVIASS